VPDLDLIVIGGGMAGINAAVRATEAGARVALVERWMVGGTCPTRGCIPSKALIRSAEIAHQARRAGEFGVRVGEVEVDFRAVMARVRGIIELGSNNTRKYLESLDGLDLVLGDARFTGPGRVEADGRTLRAPKVIVCTGAEPSVPPIPGLDRVQALTSDDVLLRVEELPRRLVVIGGGPVALELGQALGRLGAAVTLIEMAPRLLPGMEPALADALAEMLTEEGVEILTGTEVQRVEPASGGGVAVVVRRAGVEGVVTGDGLLVATGRAPVVNDFGLQEIGVEADDHGVRVDARLRTTRPDVWAGGDVVGPPYGMFTPVARRMGESAAENALGLDPHDVDPDVGPRAIFTDPELATVGLTEAAARDEGYQVRVGEASPSGGRARALGEEHGLCRVVCDARTGRILGAHVLLYHGAELLHPVAVAMAAGDGTAAPVLATPFIHPTLGEVVRSAVEQAAPPR
jgi:pyruvate/2-oxoglutarate dehydrogenase complex dihydrolipoamide dehydrogenase (E3) component